MARLIVAFGGRFANATRLVRSESCYFLWRLLRNACGVLYGAAIISDYSAERYRLIGDGRGLEGSGGGLLWVQPPSFARRHRKHVLNKRNCAWSKASAAGELNSSVFWVITRRTVVWNRRFGTSHQSHLRGSSLNMWPIGSSETSVLNHLPPRDNPEDGRIQTKLYTTSDEYVLRCRRTCGCGFVIDV